jgi:hypothetical protein
MKKKEVIEKNKQVEVKIKELWSLFDHIALVEDSDLRSMFNGNVLHVFRQFQDYFKKFSEKVEKSKISSNSQNIEKIAKDILKIASTIKKIINGWNVEISTHVTRGADPTQVMTVKMSKDKDKIELQEFQGLVKIDWKVENSKEKIPSTIPISNFAGADETKKLDKLLSSVGAPTWTKIEELYEKSQGESMDYDYK